MKEDFILSGDGILRYAILDNFSLGMQFSRYIIGLLFISQIDLKI